MSSYADDANIDIFMKGLKESVNDDLMALSLTVSDNWIDRQVDGLNKSKPPALVAQAAEFYAVSFILNNLYDTSDGQSSVALWYEQEAKDSIKAYSAKHEDKDDLTNPYSSSLTPTRRQMNKNKRTAYDYSDYEYVDTTKWDAEE